MYFYIYIQFFFCICAYVFATLFGLVLLARITKPHSLKVLNYLKSKLKNRGRVVGVYAISILLLIMYAMYYFTPFDYSQVVEEIVLNIITGIVTGAFIAFSLLAIIRLLPEYLDDKEK